MPIRSPTWKDSCLLLYYPWRPILFLEVTLGLPLLAACSLQLRCRPDILQLRNMFSDQCNPCHLSRRLTTLTQRVHTFPRVRLAPMLTPPLCVSHGHSIVPDTWRLAPFLLEVATIRHPRYLYPATTPALPELLARTASAIGIDITQHRRPHQTSEKPAQALCSQTPPHFLSTHPSP